MRRQKYAVVPVFAVLFVIVSGVAQAAPIQVSSLASLRDAIQDADSGALIQLAPGIYQQSETITITDKNNITISGGTDDFDDTVLKGPGINDPDLGINIKVKNSDSVTLTDLTLKDSYFHGVQVKRDSDGFAANNVKTIDNGEAGFKISAPRAESGYSDNGTIKNSVIGFSETGQRNVVEGIDIIAAKGWHIVDNMIKNIKKANGGPAYAVFAKGNAQNIVFADNTVKNSFIGLSFGGGGTGAAYFRNGETKYETRGGVIKNNLIYNLADSGIYLNQAKNFLVDGNTVLKSGAKVGSITARFPESSGKIINNVTSGPIVLRVHATALIRGNVEIPADTPVSSISDPGADDGIPTSNPGAGDGVTPPGLQVDAPSGWRFWSLLALAGASILWMARRQRRGSALDTMD